MIDLILSRLHTSSIRKALYLWRYFAIRLRYSFREVGFGCYIPFSCQIQGADHMELGNNVTMSWDCRLLTPLIWLPSDDSKLTLRIDDNVSLGRRCTISAANRVLIGSNVLVGPNVLIVDHNHNYKDIHRPIRQQGWSRNGYIVIEQNCWIGANVVIIGSKGITIGQGSVIGANTVVTKSVPKFSVVAGNPCKILSHYDESAQQWVSAGELV